MSNQSRLKNATSPYLQQHADNPVDWFPWGNEAIQKACQENKPILLSIGYFACHWCHVMARESFANNKTAEIMNKYFISIKVDREERPDLDKVYQLAHQVITGRSGGWPLTIFLNPHNLIPFYAGTYFPPEPRYGMPSFNEVLLNIASFFNKHSGEILQQNNNLKNALSQLEYSSVTDQILSTEVFSKALKELVDSFDKVHGGFGGSPKFPHPSILDYLIYQEDQHEMAYFTLLKMAKGGIYDQLGGGFFRYSVDSEWQIPHFEKMLYDNAQLLSCYSQMGLIKHDHSFSQVVKRTVNWLLDEMQAPEGGFYSALDADSEHIEGKYYYWDKAEIKTLLTLEEYEAISIYYGLNQTPNFETHWHFTICDEKISDSFLESAKQKLLAARKQKTRPDRDEKILTSWNALLIKGLSSSSRYLIEDDLLSTTIKIVEFIRNNLWKENKLYACYRNNQTYQVAFLDDYAFLIDALLDLLQAHWSNEYLTFATNLIDVLISDYYDNENGGFFFTPHNYESLIFRSKPLADNVIPSGNGIITSVLIRLGYLLGNTHYLQVAEKTLKMAWASLQSSPSWHCSFLKALTEYFDPPEINIVRANAENLKLQKDNYYKNYDPKKLTFFIANEESELPDALKDRYGHEKEVVIYTCKGTECKKKILF